MFYILVVKEAIGNTESDYSTLSAKTKDARMDGYLPIDCFVDEVRQTIDNGYEDDDGFESDEDYIKRAIDYLYNAPDKYVESLPKWYKQKHYLEEWLEKAATLDLGVCFVYTLYRQNLPPLRFSKKC